MTNIALIQVGGERCQKDAKKVFPDVYFFEATITEKELQLEIKDLADFYDEIRIDENLPPHIRYKEICSYCPTGQTGQTQRRK